MHDLQLVGFTTDRRGLIFRTRAGARSEASFVVPVTDELIELVGQIAAEQPRLVDAPGVVLEVDEAGTPPEEEASRPRSLLSVRDIQARLRAGEATARIATEAGVDEEWIERFAPPVRAEQQRIVARALECHLRRSRSAPSQVPLRRAVGMALADKGIAYTVAAYEAAWSARLLGHDRWAVTFTYRHRGRERVATWSYDAAEDLLTTTDRTAAQLGYVAPGRAADDDGEAIDGIVGDPSAVAARSTSAAAEEPSPAPTRSTRTKKAASRSAKRVTAKKAATKKRSPAKKAAVEKRSPAKKAAVEKRSPAKKAAAEKRSPAKKASVEKSAAKGKPKAEKKAPARKPAAERSAVPEMSRAPKTSVAPTRPVALPPIIEGPESRPAPAVDDVVDAPPAPPARRLPDELPRPAEVSVATAPLAARPPVPASNGRPSEARSEPADRPERRDDHEADPASARRARAAQRNAPTVQFRSGSAAPVRAAAARASAADDRPAVPDDRPDPDRRETNGAARPATRRRRQLRAR